MHQWHMNIAIKRKKMYDVVLFSDTSLTENDFENSEEDNMAKAPRYHEDRIKEVPARGAGVHRIKSEVRAAGYTCQVIDLFYYFTEEEISTVCDKFISNNTLVVGFSTTFWYNLKKSNHKLRLFKFVYNYVRNLKKVKIVFGGSIAAEYAAKVYADKTFTGFSEEAFINYLHELSGDPTTLSFDFTKSQITYDSTDCIDFEESVVIEIARGCIFKCSFCSYPLNGKKKFDYIKEENVLKEELIQNYENHGITTYTLSDDTFNDSTYKMDYLHKLFTSLPFKIKFISYLRLDLLNAHREQILQLKEMGLIGVFFGVESLNHESSKIIGKGMDPEKTKELLYDLKHQYWKNDVNITIGLISGLPKETAKSHQETIDWILNKEYCLVDRIRPTGLIIPNPLITASPWKSEFQLNASKYGFYWPDPKSNDWKNFSQDVKSQKQATVLAREVYIAAKQVDKVAKGNFSLPLYANIGKYGNDPKTLEDIINMAPTEYSQWSDRNKHDMIDGYVNNYKRKILAL